MGALDSEWIFDGGFDFEELGGVEPFVDLSDEFINIGTPLVSSYHFVHVPPNSFDGIVFSCVGGQQVNGETMAVPGQVFPNDSAVANRGVVADRMNVPVAAKLPTQVIEIPHEEIGVASPTGFRQMKPAGPPWQ